MFSRKSNLGNHRTSRKLSLEKCEERKLLTACTGDVTGDYQVGFDDFLEVSGQFGQAVDPAGSGADLDGDGMVGFSDFLMVSGEFGKVCEPDLVVSKLEITSVSADAVFYEFELTNQGDAPANLEGPTDVDHDNVSVQAFFSQDTVFNNEGDQPAGGAVLGTSPLGDLMPGESMTQSRKVSIPFNAGTHPFLTIKADWGGVVAESHEGNNTAAAKILSSQFLDVSVDTPSPEHLANGERVNVSFSYMTDLPDGVRIWARPMTNGAVSPGYAAHGSPVHTDAVGQGTGYFTFHTENVEVDQVRFQMWTDDQSELLDEEFVDVDIQVGYENNIFDVSFDKPHGSRLDHGDPVNLSFSYTTDETEGVYIWARPMTGGALTPNYAAHPSPLHMSPTGDGTGFFRIDAGYAEIDQVRLQMWNQDKSELLNETIVDVDFTYGERIIIPPIFTWNPGEGILK